MPKFSSQIKKIVNAINEVGKFNYIIGIDGCSASGKTTLSEELAKVLDDVFVIHIDDFYKPEALRIEAALSGEIGSFYDWFRLKKQVLTPFTLSEDIKFQKYSWEDDSLSDYINVPEGSSIIIEGIYSTRKEFSKYFDLKIWVDATAETRERRRELVKGPEKKEYWQQVWLIQEEKYIKTHKPIQYAHLIVDGNGK